MCCLSCCLQNGSAGWTDEADSNRGRGEASRDFAKVSMQMPPGVGGVSQSSEQDGRPEELQPACFRFSSTNWTVTPRGRTSWTTFSPSCRREVSLLLRLVILATAGWLQLRVDAAWSISCGPPPIQYQPRTSTHGLQGSGACGSASTDRPGFPFWLPPPDLPFGSDPLWVCELSSPQVWKCERGRLLGACGSNLVVQAVLTPTR